MDHDPGVGENHLPGSFWAGEGVSHRRVDFVRKKKFLTKFRRTRRVGDCLERFAPCVNAGCGGLRTLTRDRRTLKGSSCVWVAQYVCRNLQQFCWELQGFAGICRNLQEFCIICVILHDFEWIYTFLPWKTAKSP